MNNKIVAFGGVAGSGKNTMCNFLHGYLLKSYGMIDGFEITDEGKLVVETEIIDNAGHYNKGRGLIDVTRTDVDFAIWASANMWPFVKHYAFATALKEIAVELFGLPREKVFGVGQSKSSFSQYQWEKMPTKVEGKSKAMTVRDFLQYLGTDIFRKIREDVWVNRAILDILAEQSMNAIISDVRFENEAKAVQKAGGRVVFLTGGTKVDSHSSETSLTPEMCDATIDTEKQSIQESCEALLAILNEWGWLEKEIVFEVPQVPRRAPATTSIRG
jgi:hypothetical protein